MEKCVPVKKGRPLKYKTEEERAAAKRKSNKKYYNEKQKFAEKTYLKPAIFDNCFNRITKHDRYIVKFLQRVGVEKVQHLLNTNC